MCRIQQKRMTKELAKRKQQNNHKMIDNIEDENGILEA